MPYLPRGAPQCAQWLQVACTDWPQFGQARLSSGPGSGAGLFTRSSAAARPIAVPGAGVPPPRDAQTETATAPAMTTAATIRATAQISDAIMFRLAYAVVVSPLRAARQKHHRGDDQHHGYAKYEGR